MMGKEEMRESSRVFHFSAQWAQQPLAPIVVQYLRTQARSFHDDLGDVIVLFVSIPGPSADELEMIDTIHFAAMMRDLITTLCLSKPPMQNTSWLNKAQYFATQAETHFEDWLSEVQYLYHLRPTLVSHSRCLRRARRSLLDLQNILRNFVQHCDAYRDITGVITGKATTKQTLIGRGLSEAADIGDTRISG